MKENLPGGELLSNLTELLTQLQLLLYIFSVLNI